MHRLKSGLLLIPMIALVIVLSGCLGKSSSNPGNGGVKTVTLNPSGKLSFDVGNTQFFSATATDGQGRTIIGVTPRFVVTTPPGSTGAAPISITSAGNACAGTWDQTLSLCSAGTPGVAIVIAVVNGVSSVPTTVYVHYHIDSLQVKTAKESDPPYDCFSQGQTWIYQAVAYSHNQDITSSIGPVNWASTNSAVLTVTSYIPPQQPDVLNQAQITANNPGITQIFASISGTASNSIPIATCLVQYIRLQAAGSNLNSITVNNGTSITVNATVVDTLGFTLPKPPLTWSTSNPEVVSFSSTTSSTGTNTATAHNNLGGASITASCTPPTCNIGVLPGVYVFAGNGPLPPPSTQQGYGSISVNVTTTSKTLPTYSAWAATDMCNEASGCSSIMYGITPTNSNPISGVVSVPRTPHSMLFNYGSRVYLGSKQGLMYVDVGGTSTSATLVSQSTTPCNVSLCGEVLAISNDGKLVVVGDDVSSTPQAYIYNSNSGAVTDLVLSDVPKVASFSPDQSKAFIVTNNGTLYVYSTVKPLGVVPVAAFPSAAAFSADGSFTYIADQTLSVTPFSMCDPSTALGNPVATAAAPEALHFSPVTQVVKIGSDFFTQENIVAVEPPYIQILTAEYLQVPLPRSQYVCNDPQLTNFTAGTAYNLEQGIFQPLYTRLVANGTAMIIVARGVPAVILLDLTTGIKTSVSLSRSGYAITDPLSASSSSDGSQVYVAACDEYAQDGKTCTAGSVHVVSTNSLVGHYGDYLQVPYINNSTNNMCNGLGENAPLCSANLVAVKPQ